jgi:hypothetical protein
MPRILVVEGLTDATFFQELFHRLYLRDAQVESQPRFGRERIPQIIRGTQSDGSLLEVEFRNQQGKANIANVIEGLLTEEVLEFSVAKDIDAGSPGQVLQSIRGTVYAHFGLNPPVGPASKTIKVEGRTITILPMGLYQDDALVSLEITSYAVEDYLIKLLLEDTSLRNECPELLALLAQILPVIRSYDGSFNASKELFQLIKPIVKHGFSDTGVVHSLFQNANTDILRSVLAPVLADVEQALTVQ